MSTLTQTGNPSLFAGAPQPPTGFTYTLQSTSNIYTYGQRLPLYQIGVTRTSDGQTIWGTPFYPYNGYPDVTSMINTECQNALDNFLEYNAQDQITAAAKAAIGF